MIKRNTILSVVAFTAGLLMNSTSFATGLDISGYGLFSSDGDISLVNLSSTTISGNVRSQTSTCTINNLSSVTITGNLVCLGNIRVNNVSSGRVTGVVQSTTSISLPRSGFTVSGGSTVVNSISSLSLATIAPPSSTSDSNYLLPITIITGDYTVNGSTTLNGTIYATGNIHINNGNISGSGALVAGGAIHLNNLSSVGSSNARLFLYAMGTGGIDTNNISSLTVRGSLYAPAGLIKMNNISTLNVTAGIFGKTLNLNNISSLTIGPGTPTSTPIPPGITNQLNPPSAPSNLVASSASFTSISLSWIDNSNNEDTFRIERSSNGVAFTEVGSVGSNVTTYVDSGLATNSTYYYRVRARNSVADSNYTNIANATLLSPPNAPSNLAATATSDTQIDLSWSDNSSNETTFRVERSTDGSSFSEIGHTAANIVAYSDTGLTSGRTYYYRVRARNSAGDSDYSNTANATTTSTVDPCDPTLVSSGYNSSNTYVSTAGICGLLLR